MVTKSKSPNYPGVDLGEAIELTGKLRQRVGKNQFTQGDAAQAWGHRSASGALRVKIAALRQYGLIEGKLGNHPENPRLSRRAWELLMLAPDSREYRETLQDAALSPPLFSEVRQAHPRATDGVLRRYLVMDRGFTEEGAERFISAYNSTMRLAVLDVDDTMSGLEEDESASDDGDGEVDSMTTVDDRRSVGPKVPDESMTIPVPLGPDRMATVKVPNDMGVADWARFDRVVDGYKSLVETREEG